MGNIKAVLWDIDSTLLDPILPERNAIRRCFEDFGFGPVSDELLLQYPAINQKWWDLLYEGKKTKEELTVGRFTDFLKLCNVDSSKAAEFNNDYMNRLGDTISPTPNSLETVSALQGRVKQYIVTNGMVRAQQKKLTGAGIDKLVDGIFISEAVGYDKPSKEFFDVVFEKTGLNDKDSIMIVGDSLTTDMLGGNNAGILCTWYNPSHKQNTLGVRIDYEIEDIAQVLLLDIL